MATTGIVPGNFLCAAISLAAKGWQFVRKVETV
jgi:hypothetical protein